MNSRTLPPLLAALAPATAAPATEAPTADPPPTHAEVATIVPIDWYGYVPPFTVDELCSLLTAAEIIATPLTEEQSLQLVETVYPSP